MPFDIPAEKAQALAANGMIRPDQAAMLAQMGIQSPEQQAAAQPAVAGMAPSLPKVDAPAPDMPMPAGAPDARLAMNAPGGMPAGGGPDPNDSQAVASFMGLPQRGAPSPTPAALEAGGMGAPGAAGAPPAAPMAPPGAPMGAGAPPGMPAPLTPNAAPGGMKDPLAQMRGVTGDPRVQGLSNTEKLEDAQVAQQGQATANFQQNQQALAGIQDDAAKAEAAIEATRSSRGEDAYQAQLQHYHAAEKATAELAAMNPGTDNSWHNKSTGAKVGYIALSIGSMLLPFLKPAVHAMDRAAEEDVANQRAAYESKKEQLGRETNLYGDAMKLTGSSDQAAIMAKSALLGQQEQKLGSLAAKYKGTQAGDNYQAAFLEVQKKRSDARVQLATQIGGERARAAAAQAQAIESAKQREFENGLKLRGQENEEAKTDVEREKINPGQKTAVEDAELANDQDAFDTNFKTAVSNLPDRASDAYSSSVWNTDSHRQYEASKAALATLLKAPGLNSDNDFKTQIEPRLPKPGDSPEVVEQKRADLLKLFKSKHMPAVLRKQAADKLTQAASSAQAMSLGVGPVQ